MSPVTTIEELLALPEDGQRHELPDGVHVVTPSPAYRHQDLVGNLLVLLRAALLPSPDAPHPHQPRRHRARPAHLVQPDLFVVRIDPSIRPWHGPTPAFPARHRDPLPSTAARDRGAKRRIYQAAGVAEYWIVDPDARLIERWTPGEARPEIITDRLVWEPEAGVRVEVGVEGVFGG
ncbi:MAG: Uma2 family endonuclease [Gemmatimonadetes bacterium]|nr:Uma2 family endonuclease [Gemmatimonadota bacterium]